MSGQTRKRCGMPCLTHPHDCDRSPGHTGVHRDVQQKGDHGCEWDTPHPKDFPALMAALRSTRAEVERLRAERTRTVDALSDVGRTAEAAKGDLEDGINAELLAADITMATVEGAVKRVRDLHAPVAAHAGDPDDDDTLMTACAYCSVPYPCQTIAALDGTEAGR